MSEKDVEFVRVAAYYIWESQGRPAGRDAEIWMLAEKAVKKAPTKKSATKAAAKPAVKKEAAKKAAPAVKAVAKKPAAKAVAKTKINPVPVKTAASKIITPLYGSVKK